MESNKEERTDAEKALYKISNKEYTKQYIEEFKSLAKVTDEMMNGEFEDDEEVVGVNALEVPCFLLHNQAFIKGYNYGSTECGCKWISCEEELPNPEEHTRVLVHVKLKNKSKDNSISIMDASVVKHYNKQDTHWMPLPTF
jgi:hypothetical protein